MQSGPRENLVSSNTKVQPLNAEIYECPIVMNKIKLVNKFSFIPDNQMAN